MGRLIRLVAAIGFFLQAPSVVPARAESPPKALVIYGHTTNPIFDHAMRNVYNAMVNNYTVAGYQVALVDASDSNNPKGLAQAWLQDPTVKAVGVVAHGLSAVIELNTASGGVQNIDRYEIEAWLASPARPPGDLRDVTLHVCSFAKGWRPDIGRVFRFPGALNVYTTDPWIISGFYWELLSHKVKPVGKLTSNAHARRVQGSCYSCEDVYSAGPPCPGCGCSYGEPAATHLARARTALCRVSNFICEGEVDSSRATATIAIEELEAARTFGVTGLEATLQQLRGTVLPMTNGSGLIVVVCGLAVLGCMTLVRRGLEKRIPAENPFQ